MPLVLEKKIPWENSQFSKKYLSFGPWEKNAQKLLSSVSKKNSKVLVFWSLWTKSQKSLFLVLEEKMPKNDCLLFLKKCQKYLVFEKKILKNFCLLVLGKKNSQKSLFSVPKKQNSKIFVFWSLRKKSLLVFK